METKDVAQKWYSMCQNNQNLDCVNELYADNVTSREMPGMPGELTKGKQNVWDKNKQ